MTPARLLLVAACAVAVLAGQTYEVQGKVLTMSQFVSFFVWHLLESLFELGVTRTDS